MNNPAPTPLVLDRTVLDDLARGDIGTIELIQGYDIRGQPMVVPTLAITAALRETSSEDAADGTQVPRAVTYGAELSRCSQVSRSAGAMAAVRAR